MEIFPKEEIKMLNFDRSNCSLLDSSHLTESILQR